ncbi:MAG: hydrolase [Dehalococcoidia bacterium]|nr:hydrolase [Dehalococcoidia bacterium]
MLRLDNTFLVFIDVQGNLAQAMYEKEALFDNLQRLVRGMRVLEVPIIVTEQNPKGLGPTISQLAQLLTGIPAIPKFAFSCCGDPQFAQELQKLNRKQALIAGIETHVCVYQTAMDLMAQGYEVQIVADCVSSRTARNRDIGFARLQGEGAKLTCTEMALFELLKAAEGAKFKEIIKIVK